MFPPKICRASWLPLLLILLFAPVVCALDPAAQLRAGYPDLLKALAADGVHIDLARAPGPASFGSRARLGAGTRNPRFR